MMNEETKGMELNEIEAENGVTVIDMPAEEETNNGDSTGKFAVGVGIVALAGAALGYGAHKLKETIQAKKAKKAEEKEVLEAYYADKKKAEEAEEDIDDNFDDETSEK